MNFLRRLIIFCLSALATFGQDPTGFQSAWRSTFDASGFDGPLDAILDARGNFLVAGTTSAADRPSDGLLIKLTPSGDRLWARRFDSAISETDFFSAVAVDPQGNPAVVGLASDRDARSALVIGSYDAQTGATRWLKQYPGSYITAGAVAVDANGNVLATAAVENGSGQTLTTYKTSPAGVPLWTNELAAARDLSFAVNARLPLLVAPDGGCFLATLTTSTRGDLDWLLVRLRANGTEQWRKLLGGTNLEAQPLLTFHSSGDLLLAGTSENDTGGLDILIERLNPTSGDRVWQSKFRGASVFKAGSHVPVSIRSSREGEILLAGNSPGWGGFISRFSAAGEFAWTTHFPQMLVAGIPLPGGGSFITLDSGVAWAGTNGAILKFEQDRPGSVPVADAEGNVFVAGSYYKPESAGDFGLFAEKLIVNRHELAPTFTQLAEITGGLPNQSVLLAPAATGPDLRFNWAHNGVVLPGATNSTFTIASLDATTVGFYSVQVTNQYGLTLSPDIEVLTATPIFIVQPKPQTLVQGGDVAFSALAVGLEPQVSDLGALSNLLVYQWYYEGFPLPGENRSKLVIRNADASWIGSYSVRATIYYPSLDFSYSADSDSADLSFPYQSVEEIWRDQFILFNEPWTRATGLEVKDSSTISLSLQSPHLVDRANIVNGQVTTDVAEGFAPAQFELPHGPHFVDSRGNFYSIGETNRVDTTFDWAVTRRSSDGTLLWSQTVGSLGREIDLVVDAAVDARDNIVITGASGSQATGRDALTVALRKEDGSLLWRSSFHDADGVRVSYAGEQPSALALDKDGNTFVAGTGFWATNGFSFLVSYDANGSERFVWHRGWDYPVEPAPKLAVDGEGNAVLAGAFGLIKVDPTGRELWLTDLRLDENSPPPTIQNLAIDRSGSIFVSGATVLGAAFAKFDAFGGLLGQINPALSFPESLFELNGRFYLDDFGNVYLPGTGGNTTAEQDMILMKFNSTFGRLWMARLDGVAEKSDRALAVKVIGNDVFLTGQVTHQNTFQAGVMRLRETPADYRVTDISTSRMIRRGSALRLEAQAFGNPPFYQWYKDFAPIPGATSPVFTIPSAGSNDEGFYNLQAGDLFSSAFSGGFAIRIADPPQIIVQPMPVNVSIHDQVRLVGNATGTEPLFYQWQRDGSVLPRATNRFLVVDDAQFYHRGMYRLVVSNAWGVATSSPATVSISAPANLPPVVMLAEPADRLVQRSTTPVRLRAAVYDADGRVTQVAFRVNGNVVATISAAPFETLWTPPGPGVYRVSAQAVDDLRASTVSAGQEVVIAPPPIITQQPPPTLQIAENADLILRAEATSTPPPRYQWRLNGANIPGATNQNYIVGGAQVRHSGRYTVVVVNEGAATVSRPTEVIVAAPELTLADRFADAITSRERQFTGRGNNLNATREAGEINHFKKRKGSSVWLKWQAPAGGVMTVDTRGSAIDTLLAIFTGASFSQLTLSAADDERGGFHCSATRFNAVQGQTYFIMIDGFNGQTGNIVLNWSLDSSARALPVVVGEPESVSALNRGVATFRVDAQGTGLRYQWFFNGYPIPGANSASLVLPGIASSHLGSYVVQVSNDAGTVESVLSELELGSGNEPVTQDRVEDLFSSSGGGAPLRAEAAFASYPTISPGIPYQKSFNNEGATTDSNEPILGNGGGASKWYLINAGGAGTLVADTIGSEFPTIITLHDPAQLDTLPVLATGEALPGGASRVTYPAVAGAAYLIRVDGLDEREGDVILNVTIGAAPSFASGPLDQVIARGANATLSAAVTASPAANYQWYLNGAALPGQTTPSLQLSGFDPAQAGAYALEASNALGSARQTVAYVELARPLSFSLISKQADGSTLMRLEGNTRTYSIDFTRDFITWTTNIFSGRAENGALQFSDPYNASERFRFYRAR